MSPTISSSLDRFRRRLVKRAERAFLETAQIVRRRPILLSAAKKVTGLFPRLDLQVRSMLEEQDRSELISERTAGIASRLSTSHPRPVPKTAESAHTGRTQKPAGDESEQRTLDPPARSPSAQRIYEDLLESAARYRSQ